VEPLDGNAIAGMLFEYFGTEMTMTTADCAHCGASARIAELTVFVCAPGTVVRCPSCGEVVMVLVTIRGELRVDMDGLRMSDG
jgi:hypothetical protein